MRAPYTYQDVKPHVCLWCGTPLVRKKKETAYHFNRRKSCGNGTKCHRSLLSQSIRTAANGGIIPCQETGKLMWDNPLDEEQHRINKLCAKLDAERMGLSFDEGRTLSKAEISALTESGQITPIKDIRSGVYHQDLPIWRARG